LFRARGPAPASSHYLWRVLQDVYTFMQALLRKGNKMNVINIVAEQTNSKPEDWVYMEGPTTGVGAEYWLANEATGEEVYVCVDQENVTIQAALDPAE